MLLSQFVRNLPWNAIYIPVFPRELFLLFTKMEGEVSFFRVFRQNSTSLGLNYKFLSVCSLIWKAVYISEFSGRLINEIWTMFLLPPFMELSTRSFSATEKKLSAMIYRLNSRKKTKRFHTFNNNNFRTFQGAPLNPVFNISYCYGNVWVRCRQAHK